MEGLFSAIRSAARINRKCVAIGIHQSTPTLIASLQETTDFADIISVGVNIEGFESILEVGGKAVADRLMSLVSDGRVDAIVRGQVYYTDYHTSMRRRFGFSRDLMCPCLIKDLCGNEWFLTPVVHHDDSSVTGRCYLARQAARICAKLGIEPVIGVLAADNERGYLTRVDESLDEAEAIVKVLRSDNYTCKMYPLRIDLAASECNIVVSMDGIVGNFVCRSLGYLGGASIVGGFTLTPSFVSLDTSRSNDKFSTAIMSAVAMCNLGGMPVDEYTDLDYSA